jgi:two-component sensor histidine kinase
VAEEPNGLLQRDTAQAIGVRLHELATNAAKHGALSRA